jgi:type I restriction enzyme S subunit
MSDTLPTGWVRVLLAEATYFVPTGVPAFDGEVEYYSTGSIQSRSAQPEGRFTIQSRPSRANRWGREGDVLQARMQGTEKGILVCQQLANRLFSTGFLQLRPVAGVSDPQFVAHYVRSYEFLSARDELASGSTQVALTDSSAKELTIPLPPFAEQQRIVAKLDTLLGEVDTCQRRLANIPHLLKRFRQSVLAAACSGRLTVDWRRQNPAVETGHVLLERIREKRLALAPTKKQKAQIEKVFDEANLRIDEEDRNEMPVTWIHCRVGAVGTVCNGSTPSRTRPEFWDGKIPWVSSGQVRNNVITETRERISHEGYESSSVRILPPGTVLLAMIGEGKTRGQTAILSIEATINQNIAAVVLEHGLISSAFLWRWFQLKYEATRERGSGSGPQALNCQRVREIPFVLPPLAEQHEIVRRMDQLFTFADQLEARFAKARAHADKLTQSFLAKAFRGELVPQDPNDEPASALLARMRSGANEAPKPRGERRHLSSDEINLYGTSNVRPRRRWNYDSVAKR